MTLQYQGSWGSDDELIHEQAGDHFDLHTGHQHDEDCLCDFEVAIGLALHPHFPIELVVGQDPRRRLVEGILSGKMGTLSLISASMIFYSI